MSGSVPRRPNLWLGEEFFRCRSDEESTRARQAARPANIAFSNPKSIRKIPISTPPCPIRRRESYDKSDSLARNVSAAGSRRTEYSGATGSTRSPSECFYPTGYARDRMFSHLLSICLVGLPRAKAQTATTAGLYLRGERRGTGPDAAPFNRYASTEGRAAAQPDARPPPVVISGEQR